jgi:hypothetical protein
MAVDVVHEFKSIRVGRIKETDHNNVIFEVRIERISDDQIGPQLEELERADVGDVAPTNRTASPSPLPRRKMKVPC